MWRFSNMLVVSSRVHCSHSHFLPDICGRNITVPVDANSSVWGIPLTRKKNNLMTKSTSIFNMLSSNQNVFFVAYHLSLCVHCSVLMRDNLWCFVEALWRSLFSLRRPFTLRWQPLALKAQGTPTLFSLRSFPSLLKGAGWPYIFSRVRPSEELLCHIVRYLFKHYLHRELFSSTALLLTEFPHSLTWAWAARISI